MWVRGRYLATFCSNCFGISRNQVAEKVAAAVLVATSRHRRNRNRTHFTYDLYDEITRVGQTVSSTLADKMPRGVNTPLLSGQDGARTPQSTAGAGFRQKAPSRSAGSRLL